MQAKTEKKAIDTTKMDKFLDKLKNLPESTSENTSQDPVSMRQKFLQKILDDIGPQ